MKDERPFAFAVPSALDCFPSRCSAQIPIFFTSFAYDPADPPSPHDKKLQLTFPADADELFDLDPRLERRPSEKLIRKRYASAFKEPVFTRY